VSTTALSGCRTEYIVERRTLDAAEMQLALTSRSPAVPAERVRDGAQVHVRYEALDLVRARPMSPTHVVASAPERRPYRVAGPIVLGIGLAAASAGIGVITWDMTRSCARQYECWRGIGSLALGLPLEIVGLAHIITGGILMHKGYRDSSEVKAPEHALVYSDGDPKARR